jgi:hypothetical protein
MLDSADYYRVPGRPGGCRRRLAGARRASTTPTRRGPRPRSSAASARRSAASCAAGREPEVDRRHDAPRPQGGDRDRGDGRFLFAYAATDRRGRRPAFRCALRRLSRRCGPRLHRARTIRRRCRHGARFARGHRRGLWRPGTTAHITGWRPSRLQEGGSGMKRHERGGARRPPRREDAKEEGGPRPDRSPPRRSRRGCSSSTPARARASRRRPSA